MLLISNFFTIFARLKIIYDLDNLFQVIPAGPEHFEIFDVNVHGESATVFKVVQEVVDVATEIALDEVPEFKLDDIIVLVPEVPEEKIAISDNDGAIDFAEKLV